MGQRLLQATFRHLARGVGRQAMRQFTDAELLRRFTTTHDEDAYAALVDRHGGLVLRLSRWLLPQTQDAEDCFQATFMLLAQKAGTIRKSQAVGSWLYGVTRRVAMNAKRQAACRRKHEQHAAMSQPSRGECQPPEIVTLRELQALLEAEVANLPEKYRAPFILCCLEGKTGSAAARDLGCKEGTVTARITQARHLLQGRLARRGVKLSAALTAAALATPAANAAIPHSLTTATIEAALRISFGQSTAGVLSASVTSLVQGTSRAMLLKKIKTASLLVVLVLSGTGVAAISYKAAAQRGEVKQEGFFTPRLSDDPRSVRARKDLLDLHGDPLPTGAIARLGTMRLRQGHTVGQFAFMPDSKIVATGEDKWINFWDIATGKIVRRIDSARGTEGLAISQDGKILAVGLGGIQIFDLITGQELRRFGEGTVIASLAFSPDGKTLASCAGAVGLFPNRDTTIRLWDIATGKEMHRLTGHKNIVHSSAFSPDGKVLASTSWDDRAVRLWDTTTGNEIVKLKHREVGEESAPPSAAFSPDGKLLATADYGDDSVRFWDTTTYQEVLRIKDVHGIKELCFSPDGRTLAIGGNQLLLFDVGTGKRVRELNDYSDDDPIHRSRSNPIDPIQSSPSLRFSPDGKCLAASRLYSNTLYLWDPASGKRLLPFEGHQLPIQSIAFSRDGKRLATNTLEYEICWWDHGTTLDGFAPTCKDNSGGRVAISPNSQHLAKESISEVVLIDAATEHELRRFQIPQDRYYGWSSLVFSEDGKYLIWTGNLVNSYVAYIWEVNSGRTVHAIEKKQQLGCDGNLIFAPDLQTYAVTGFHDTSFQLLETATGNVIQQFLGHESRVAPVVFSPDGKTLASGSYDKTLRLWDTATGRELHKFTGHKQRVTCLAFSPDGRSIASASDDNTIRVWDIATGKECCRFEGHRGIVTCLAFAPNGQILVSGSADTTALVWDLSGRLTRNVTPDR